MTAIPSRLARRLSSAALVVAAAHLVASCGGSVSSPTSPETSGTALTILPATAVMYSGLPTTFILSGGTGSYIVTSSNQAIVPLSGGVTGRSVTVAPNPVSADTEVTLTLRDTGSATPVTSALTVKPGTVANDVTITPTSTQAAACGASVCSGGDAEVKTVLSQGNIPLAARGVRFEVVSGDFRIITSAPGALPEVTALQGATTTDERGEARMRIRVLPDATAQTALLQITDLATGAFRRTSFTVAPVSNAPLDAQPRAINFVGQDTTRCANGAVADVIVFGGRPPYAISQPGSVTVSPTTVLASGGRFAVGSTGQCTPTGGSAIAVVDSIGATVTVNVTSVLGTAELTPIFVVSPTAVTLNSCSGTASVIAAGGIGPPFSASSGTDLLRTTVSSATVTVGRAPGSGATTVATQTIQVTDGKSVLPVTVTLTGAGLGACP